MLTSYILVRVSKYCRQIVDNNVVLLKYISQHQLDVTPRSHHLDRSYLWLWKVFIYQPMNLGKTESCWQHSTTNLDKLLQRRPIYSETLLMLADPNRLKRILPDWPLSDKQSVGICRYSSNGWSTPREDRSWIDRPLFLSGLRSQRLTGWSISRVILAGAYESR